MVREAKADKERAEVAVDDSGLRLMAEGGSSGTDEGEERLRRVG